MNLRWGIVAAAKISNDFVNAFNSYPGMEGQAIVAIAARNIDRAKDFAKRHNIKKAFESYRAMAESDEIDIAYIGAMNPNHCEIAELFLNNNKHVLCETTLCMNEKQAKRLVDLAKKKNKFLMEGIWSRFMPAYYELEKEINAGKLGDVKYIEATFGVPVSDVPRVTKKEMGGSVFLDIGVYLVQFAQFIFKDEPMKVTSSGILNDEGVDLVSTVVLDYSGGRRAVLNTHGVLKLWNKATVTGTEGQATLSDPFHAPVELIHVDGKVEKFPLHTSTLEYNYENSAGLAYEALEVKKCIDQGLIESPRMSHRDSLMLAKLEDTIRAQIGVHFDVD